MVLVDTQRLAGVIHLEKVSFNALFRLLCVTVSNRSYDCCCTCSLNCLLKEGKPNVVQRGITFCNEQRLRICGRRLLGIVSTVHRIQKRHLPSKVLLRTRMIPIKVLEALNLSCLAFWKTTTRRSGDLL